MILKAIKKFLSKAQTEYKMSEVDIYIKKIVSEVSNAAKECSKKYSSEEDIYLRIHFYVKYPNKEWVRIGSDMKKVKAQEAYKAAKEITQKQLTEGSLSMIKYADAKAFKVVLDNGTYTCYQDIGSIMLPL